MVARRVKHQLEGEEMDQAAGKLKWAMEGYIRDKERGGKGVDGCEEDWGRLVVQTGLIWRRSTGSW